MSQVMSLETLKDAIKNGTCEVYDRSGFGDIQTGFFVRINSGDEGSLHISVSGRVVLEYQLDEVDMKRLSVLALRQSVDRIDADRAKTVRALKRAKTELAELLKKGGHDE